jgi:hypothetical protein
MLPAPLNAITILASAYKSIKKKIMNNNDNDNSNSFIGAVADTVLR